MDLLDLFDRSSEWTKTKISGAKSKLDDPTPCERWNVRDVMSHLLDTQKYFKESAKGKDAALPSGAAPRAKLAKDPVRQYERARQSTLATYAEEGVIEKTGPALGFAFVDQLVHGWDLAKATGQDRTMPDDLAQAALETIKDMTPDQRGESFKPEVAVPENASVQDKLIAFMGRSPN